MAKKRRPKCPPGYYWDPVKHTCVHKSNKPKPIRDFQKGFNKPWRPGEKTRKRKPKSDGFNYG